MTSRTVMTVRCWLTGGALLLAACTSPPLPPPAAQPASAASPAAAVARDAVSAATQLVVVTTAGWDSITGELRRYVRADVRSPWRQYGGPVPIVVGRTGLAWGPGFDHFGVPGAPDSEPRKREGDGRSPAGIFPLGAVFGFGRDAAPPDVRMPYLELTPSIECVDDTASVHYNAIVDRNAVSHVDWSSAERMRQVAQYRLGVVVDYNPAPAVKGRGSCIFLHLWAGPRAPTVGCTALAAPELERLAVWLDPRARPLLVQVPATVYPRIRGSLALPALGR